MRLDMVELLKRCRQPLLDIEVERIRSALPDFNDQLRCHVVLRRNPLLAGRSALGVLSAISANKEDTVLTSVQPLVFWNAVLPLEDGGPGLGCLPSASYFCCSSPSR